MAHLDEVEVPVVVLDKVRLVLDALHGRVGMEGQLGKPTEKSHTGDKYLTLTPHYRTGWQIKVRLG